MGRITTWCAVAAIATAVLTVAPSADAAPTRAASAGPTVEDRHAPRRRAIITFDKNELDPSSSLLTWKVVRRDGAGAWRTLEELSWRAGSGIGPAATNECAKGRGWLPDGGYRLRYHRNYHGNLIKGRAFRLDDKRCRNGRWRVALFIHTEQGDHNTQCPDEPGDQVCRWELPEVDDYASAGCIKLAPADLAELGRHFLRFYDAGVRYPRSRVVVKVVA